MRKYAHKLATEHGLTVYSVFEQEAWENGTVNVAPEDRREAIARLHDMGYDISSVEELRETAPGDGMGDKFVRISFGRIPDTNSDTSE